MDDVFDFYFTKVDGNTASIFVNMTLEERAPIARFGCVVVIRLKMLNPRGDGLSSQAEFAALGELEDGLTAAVTNRDGAIYVGRITYAGLRDFYFYARDADAAGSAAVGAMKATPAYEFEVLSQADADWGMFRRLLLPSPRDRQCMGNRSVCKHLSEKGDSLTEPREIDHGPISRPRRCVTSLSSALWHSAARFATKSILVISPKPKSSRPTSIA